MKTPRFPWLAVILILAAPSLVRAQQQESVETPNSTGSDCSLLPRNVPFFSSGNYRMKLKIKTADPGGIVKAEVPLASCWSALNVVNAEMNAILAAATADGYTCTPLAGGPCIPLGAGDITLQVWQFKKLPDKPCGFTLGKFGGADKYKIHVGGVGSCRPKAILASTNAGNTVGEDFLPRYLVQLNPNGVHGVDTFKVFHTQGGTNPRTFTVNTGSFGSDLTGLQNAIATGFVGMGLGYQATAGNAVQSHFPDDFRYSGGFAVEGTQMPPSPLVLISNVGAVSDSSIQVTTVPGQILTQETNVAVTAAPAPGVSPWGMALLFGVLLLTGYWILQRRQRLSVRS